MILFQSKRQNNKLKLHTKNFVRDSDRLIIASFQFIFSYFSFFVTISDSSVSISE